MRKQSTLAGKAAFVAFAILVMRVSSGAEVTGHQYGVNYEIKSLAQTDWALSTSSEPNPNNVGALSTSGNSWNLMAYRLESRIKLKADDARAARLDLDGVSAFIHPRFFADLGPEVDGNLKDVNLFGGLNGGNYPANRWIVQTPNINDGN